MPVKAENIWVTSWGEHREDEIPLDLRKRLIAAPRKRAGTPDRRYKVGRTLWAEFVDWSMDQYMKGIAA